MHSYPIHIAISHSFLNYLQLPYTFFKKNQKYINTFEMNSNKN